MELFCLTGIIVVIYGIYHDAAEWVIAGAMLMAGSGIWKYAIRQHEFNETVKEIIQAWCDGTLNILGYVKDDSDEKEN